MGGQKLPTMVLSEEDKGFAYVRRERHPVIEQPQIRVSPALPLMSSSRSSSRHLFQAAQHGIGVEAIGTNLVAMIFTAATTLASNLAANGFLATIRRKLENLLAVTAAAITRQAAPDQNRIRPFCPEAPAHASSHSELVLNAIKKTGCDRAAQKLRL